jgi:hypothetical protein
LYAYGLRVSASQDNLQITYFCKESTALCTLSIVLLKYVIITIINFGGTTNGAQSGRNTTDRKNRHYIPSKLIIIIIIIIIIITTYFINTIDKCTFQ